MKKLLLVIFLSFFLISCGKHTHTFGNWVVVKEATELEEGLLERTCECGEKETSTIEKLQHAHTFGNWVVVKEATELEEGLKERTCECGEKETVSIEKLDHIHNFIEGKCYCGETIELNKYTIFFDSKGGSNIDSIELEEGKEIIKPSDPEKEGHTFICWIYGNEIWDFNSKVTSNIELVAVWQINDYKINVIIDENEKEEYTIQYGAITPEISVPTKEGYMFKGWDIDLPEFMPSNDITITAIWEEERIYTLTFDTDGGQPIESIKLKQGEQINIDIIPTKDYCVFISWDKEIPDTMPNEDITLKALWTNLKDSFEFSNNKIINYISTDSDVIIPEYYTLNGEKIFITTITEYAFKSNKNIKSIKLSDNITEVEKGAFSFCMNLKTVVFSKNVTEIKDDTFTATAIESITNLDGVTSIGMSAFDSCPYLTSITFSNSLKYIDSSAFILCSSLEEITIGDNVEYIGSAAFLLCNKLEKIIIPLTTNNIGSNAFGSCNKLTIYCKASEKPSGWEDGWSNGSKEVKWNYNE